MHKLIRKLRDRLPLEFRVLYRQFLLRVVDLETLSIDADVPRFLGQFAGVLMMFSMIQALGLFIHPIKSAADFRGMLWTVEQRMIFTTMLVAGLFSVISWDAIFPDRRDVMVLSPLPIHLRTILFAKMAAAGAVLGLALLALNFAAGFALSLILGGIPRFLLILAAYFFTMAGASLFVYGSVLTVQGLIALLLPRRFFLRLSALLQIAAFGLILCVYFLDETITSPAVFATPENQRLLAWSPPYWFFALFNQVLGTLPANLAWLADRAWAGLAIAVPGAVASLLLCYLRTMRKTVEEPDLVPGSRRSHWAPHFGSQLQTAVLQFSIRSLMRSRQHRVVLAFYLGVGFAIALTFIKHEGSLFAYPRTLSPGFLVATFAMMSFAIIGLRSVYALPVSLTANWVLRTTQLTSSDRYIAAAHRSLLLFAAAPVWIASALIAITYRPLSQAAEHLVILALLGLILADLNLLGFYKVPFTCSYLPGKSNIQFSFWVFIIVIVPLTLLGAIRELRALSHPIHYMYVVAALVLVAAGLRSMNRLRTKSAVLYFEELPEEVITTLRLMTLPPPATTPGPSS
ncbi:MAG TPA: hypothetical protein VH308_06730 [Terracidiphilus sp.]|jgi:hypothetical protein|nr:hypothetical protein [Terracidiphilus sp.]